VRRPDWPSLNRKLDEAAAHAGTVGGSGAHRDGPLRHLVGIDHGRFGRFDRGGGMKVDGEIGCAGKQREGDFLDIDVLCTVSSWMRLRERGGYTPLSKNQNLISLVNRNGVFDFTMSSKPPVYVVNV